MRIRINLQIFIFIIIFILTKQIEIYMYLMIFAFIHELGHLFSGIILGLKPEMLQIMPFGISIIFKTYEEKRQIQIKNFLIAIAGPLVNIIIAIIYKMLNLNIDIIYANLLIALFNILPIYPLDGGRILKSILSIKCLENAEKYVINVSNISIIILTMLTSLLILYFHNIALIFIIIYLWMLVIKTNKTYKLKERIKSLIKKEKEYIDI